MQANKDFIALFKKREGAALYGKNNQNLVKLSVIFALTFLVVGFAKGSLNYLDKKVNSPYVRLVEMNIPSATSQKMKAIQKDLLIDSLKKKYQYTRIEAYKNYALTVIHHQKSSKKGFDNITGRTMEHDNPLLKTIYTDKSFKGKAFGREKKEEADEDIGIIVTEKMLADFGYPKNTNSLLLDIEVDVYNDYRSMKSMQIAIPVRAVVESLPSSKDIIFTPHFYFQATSGIAKRGGNNIAFDPSLNHLNKEQLYYLLNTEKEKEVEKFIEIAKKFYNTEAKRLQWGNVATNLDTEHDFNHGTLLSIWFSNPPNTLALNDMNVLHNNFLKEKKQALQAFNFFRTFRYSFSTVVEGQKPPYDRLSINLDNLTKVEELREYILKKHELEIDLSQVRALQNYNFVASLTFIISLALILFSVISISFFVTNLLGTHLDKIKMNLGTFKAFGLDNKSLQNIYRNMMIEIVVKAALIGFGTATMLGILYFCRFLLHFFVGFQQMFTDVKGNRMEACENGLLSFSCEKYFNIFNVWTLFAVLIIGLSIYITINTIIRKVLEKSPGDLIYNRKMHFALVGVFTNKLSANSIIFKPKIRYVVLLKQLHSFLKNSF